MPKEIKNTKQIDHKHKGYNKDNLRFIYGEICESYKVQGTSINLLNTKFNWLMVSAIAVLGFSINKISVFDNIMLIGLFSIFLSLFVSVTALWSLEYARGPKLIELLNAKNWNTKNLISETSKKIANNIEINNLTINRLTYQLKINITLFLAGLMAIFIMIIT